MTTDRSAGRGVRHDLPTGLVTFLFTDIEGSSGLLQRLGAGFRDALTIHDAIMRSAIAEHDGIEINTEGDAFFAVFTSAGGAVKGAVAAQRALSAAEWPQGDAVRVRMGLHTGEGALGGGDYLGLDVHRAARVSAAAHGGQILASDATRQQLQPDAPPGLDFRDLGAYTLKGIEAPMRLHQVVADGLGDEFPPPRAGRRGSLPEARTTFVGRSSVLADGRRLLQQTRLLVLTGPGGAGKTRLAMELARTSADAFADGVFFVALEALIDARLVPSAVLQVLSVPPAGRPADEALRAALEPLELLLVLDNVEQIPDIAPLVDELLQAAPRLKVLVTTRVALRLYGEQEYQVPPLQLPDDAGALEPGELAGFEGVALFVERARASRPDFSLDGANAGAVVEVCRRLDGLPLAIELAAARSRMLSPAAILGRLDQRLKLLEDRAPNLPARQRSMRGAIEWSYALLTPGEQALLNRLSIFTGGWDLAAAEEVCSAAQELGIDVLDGLESLLDKSLIDRQIETPETRFRMLQTIQEYGREKLAEAGEFDGLARRHADYFRRVVEAAEPEFTGANPAACVARLAPDQDNIRAALDWALASDNGEIGLAIGAAAWRMWQLRGQLSEGRLYLESLLRLPSAARADELRARALTGAGGILYWQGDPASRERYQEALEIYQALGHDTGIAESYSNVGFFHLTSKPPDPEQARTNFSESLRRYEVLGDKRMVASLTGSLGYTHLVQGRPEEARDLLHRALELNLAGGYRARAADNRFALGNVLRRLRRFDEAADMYRVALAEAIEMSDATRRLAFLAAIASWAVDVGRLTDAVRLGGAVRRAVREQGGATIGAAGIVDPAEAARAAGIREPVILAELDAGERLDDDEAVALARLLLEEPVAEVADAGTGSGDAHV